MEPEGSLPHLQEPPATCPYHSILAHLIYFVSKTYFRVYRNCAYRPVLAPLSLESTVVTIRATGMNIKFSAFCPQLIYVFFKISTVYSNICTWH
jgi:hypothetical protein